MPSTELLGTGTPMRFLVVAAGSVIDVVVDSVALLGCIITAAVQNFISLFVPSIISAQFTVALVIVVGPVVFPWSFYTRSGCLSDRTSRGDCFGPDLLECN